jgi:hypothetical protein
LRSVILLTVFLAMYVAGSAAYVWTAPRQDTGRRRRLLAAGGASLVAVGIPLLIIALGAVGFAVALAIARHQAVSVGQGFLLATVVLSPIALIVLGVLAARGRRLPAMVAVALCVAAYALCLVRVLAASSPGVDPSASDILIPAAIGLLPPVLLTAGLLRPHLSTSGASPGDGRRSADAQMTSGG